MVEEKILWDKWYPIVWAIIERNDKQGATRNIGICGYCWKPAFIGTDIEAITINDLLLDLQKGICEEGHCCLNVKCKFNKTTPESYAVSKGWDSEKNIETVKKLWAKMTSDLASYQPYADECRDESDRDHNVGAVEFSKKRDDKIE